ncbi:TGS domain-containing protein, partial [Candidatus Woesearchaeota archaeon]|nr:TGS domain-containing protein [Candidatus Woesearchaeota archaeon]
YVPGSPEFKVLEPNKLTPKQTQALEFIRKNVLARFGSTGVQEVLNYAVFKLLDFICVFPVANSHLKDKDGNILPDCFLVPKGTTALEFAYQIHTDIGKNFIKGKNLCSSKIIGKDYILENGDVIEIITT